MEIAVRVVRARVWLSSSQFLHQDGLLSLTRVGETESVAHATLRSVQGKNGEQCSLAEVAQQLDQHKCYRTVTAAWEDPGITSGSNCPKFSLPEELAAQINPKEKANKQINLPRLDFQLFLLKPRSRGGTSARSGPMTVYLGSSGWQLSEKDVEALVSSREVVFLTTLQNELGTLEVKLRSAEDDADIPTGFTINWSSSEVLQKGLAEKARLKEEADKKLIVQLKQTASKAAKLLETRDLLLVHIHRSRAASIIQRRVRLLQYKTKEIITKLRQEEEARIAAKKAKVREIVIARNRERALAMRARLLGHLDNNRSSKNATPDDPPALKRIVEYMETERTKLKQKLEVLEMQRQQLTKKLDRPSRSAQHSPYQRNDRFFDDELVRAVQELHFTRTHSNQM
ncbi:uncharacterized protein PITG_12303 [Phytophthora infestans T30-4]|uniref:Uncharacterized protein n=1 Tax=Phytophthora infestans (strain T30-4) TaxID=403677 RepID=D0NJJ5_PHYIT|nr:uncharacterized protein PITG_12303 [Phytophthora infestans T30-4]EEY59713.1 hypothetical protein PITG_12303 [Phytophthora infestans T30-4]|eukprot:XP_002900906.1 hypothetical protein PITG_12303 [Phytophthora infestans T30-4]